MSHLSSSSSRTFKASSKECSYAYHFLNSVLTWLHFPQYKLPISSFDLASSMTSPADLSQVTLSLPHLCLQYGKHNTDPPYWFVVRITKYHMASNSCFVNPI
ncbi:UNVERIFIED_CONTAM: hypothetical protein K2H54_062603 [Gekko kuhli]